MEEKGEEKREEKGKENNKKRETGKMKEIRGNGKGMGWDHGEEKKLQLGTV